jgi:hypothetical protein
MDPVRPSLVSTQGRRCANCFQSGLGEPGELGFVVAGGNTIVQARTDADTAAELRIQLTGIRALSVVDFFL